MFFAVSFLYIIVNLKGNLDFLEDKTTAVLGDFISYVQKSDEKFLENRQFYIFWMLLHRRGTLTLDPEIIGTDSVYADILRTTPELQEISVRERSDILSYDDFTISNMDIEVVTDHGVS